MYYHSILITTSYNVHASGYYKSTHNHTLLVKCNFCRYCNICIPVADVLVQYFGTFLNPNLFKKLYNAAVDILSSKECLSDGFASLNNILVPHTSFS